MRTVLKNTVLAGGDEASAQKSLPISKVESSAADVVETITEPGKLT